MNDSAPRTSDGDPLDAPTAALAAAVLEIARHVDGEALAAPRWFALARSAELMARQPGIAALLGDEASLALAADSAPLTPIELDDVPRVHDPLRALAELAWPDIAFGGAVALDLPAESWRSSLDAADDAARRTADALRGGALRVVVAASQEGTTYSALRRDRGETSPGAADADRFVLGPALLPQLAEALAESLRELPEG
ncbi:hypothetical protein BF93_09990 [Brachybacterium phenoliresistens]|uniref:Uncharacterized protein n=1 Tax=Brachybacterium phenoliresistens TaxID=396014 RepID=Z9JNI3_9MICO|nr:PPA1309 family protein [Brachybacterium phenoliresistens]EWS79744.1 hypothetical protein BF93_09990 [Brachybacterium phenoliresistens]